MRVAGAAAVLRNLPDAQANQLLELAPNTLLAVYGEQAGWLKADVPGGFPVWVFGRFLEPTADPKVLLVARANVNMRPQPSSDVNSFPLGQKLKPGDRLAVIKRFDPALALADDWVQVWSPAGVCGWVPAEAAVALARDEDARLEWQRAERSAIVRPEPTNPSAAPRSDSGTATNAAGNSPGSAQPASSGRTKSAALQALDEARALLAAERSRDLPDFEAVRAALSRARGLEPDVLTTAEIDKEFEMVSAFEKLHRTEALLEESRLQRQQELLRARQRQWEELVDKDPLYARFTLRGRLERFQAADGTRVYRLRRGANASADLTCPSGRYDLELFVGCELGVVGGKQEGAEVEAAQGALPLALAVERLEVLAAAR
jgi:hypothetical protein